jgi:RteC protein
MKQRAIELYARMIEEIGERRMPAALPLVVAEAGFQIAAKYWMILQDELANYCFPCESEEIHFFKTLKPRFTAEMEFYSLAFHISLPLPPDPVIRRYFYKMESARLRKFIECNWKFYHYYKSGATSHDKEYFTRDNSDLSHLPAARVYDADSRTSTSHDGLVASILALERYDRYVEEQIREQQAGNDGIPAQP